MAAILASHSCYCRNVELNNQGRAVENLSFSSSVSVQDITKLERQTCYLPKTGKVTWFLVEGRQSESPTKYGTNGRPIKMVPTSEVMKRKQTSTENADTRKGPNQVVNSSNGAVNGSKRVVNGSKQDLNGTATLVKSETSSVLVKSPKIKNIDEFPDTEELKVLPSDETFSWANENYNSVQRSVDVWSFVLSLRVRVLLDNEKWAYPGGFTENKQVNLVFHYCMFLTLCLTKHVVGILND